MIVVLVSSGCVSQRHELTCNPNYVCDSWTECSDNMKVRVCVDENSCGNNHIAEGFAKDDVYKTCQEKPSSIFCQKNIKVVGERCEEVDDKECPISCNDEDSCTMDHCSSSTSYECVHDTIVPCCGNNVCDDGENYELCASDCLPDQKWYPIAKFTGVSDKNTESFHVYDKKWRYTWDCSEDSTYGTGYGMVNIFLNSEETGQTLLQESIMMGKCSGTQTTYVYKGPDNYYFNIGTANLIGWNIEVESYH